MSDLISAFATLADTIVRAAVVLLLVVNGAFVAGIVRSRSRTFVDRWTKPVLVTDAALILALVGAPVANVAVSLAGKGVAMIMQAPVAAATQNGK